MRGGSSGTPRRRTGDPRPALTQRYASFQDYRDQYVRAAEQLVAERYLLPEHLPGLEMIADTHRPLFEQ